MRYCRERPFIKWVLLTFFPECYWLIESNVVSIIAPTKQMKIFPLKAKKVNASEVFTAKFFYVNSKWYKINTYWSEKYSVITEVSKKEIDNCHSVKRLYELEKQPPWSVLQNACSERFEKISRKRFVIVYSSWFYQQKGCIKGVFLGISSIFEHLRTAASEIIQESSRDSSLFYRSGHSKEL